MKDDCKPNLKGLNRTKDNAMKDESFMCNEHVVLERISNDKRLKRTGSDCEYQNLEKLPAENMARKKWSLANDTSRSNVKMNKNKRRVDQQVGVHDPHRRVGLNQNSALNSFREPPLRKSVKNLSMKQHGYYKSKIVNKNVQLNVEQNCNDLRKSNKKSDKRQHGEDKALKMKD